MICVFFGFALGAGIPNLNLGAQSEFLEKDIGADSLAPRFMGLHRYMATIGGGCLLVVRGGSALD